MPKTQASQTSRETRQILDKMLRAHGGYQRFASAKAISYHHEFENTAAPASPRWISDETIEPIRRRVYSQWSYGDKPKATLVFDGEKTWTQAWSIENDPKFMQHLSFYFLFLPWLTQDDGVQLGEPGHGTLPGDDTKYITVRMSFAPSVGDSPKDYYDLYIHPYTYLLRGTKYIVTWGPLLNALGVPKDVESLGPFYKIFERYIEVDGLKLPTRYRTLLAADGTQYGDHFAGQFSLRAKLDESQLQMPQDGQIDKSSNRR